MKRAFLVSMIAALFLGSCTDRTPVTGPSPGPTGGPDARTCEDVVPDERTFRPRGKVLLGDVDGDALADRVTLRVGGRWPRPCRYFLAVELDSDVVFAPVRVPQWSPTEPRLTLLAQIDGRAGLEPVVALVPRLAAVHRPGNVFTMLDGRLEKMRLRGAPHGDLLWFYDEDPSGVDCAGAPGTIVTTLGGLAEGGEDDSHWDITRTFYQAAGSLFRPIGEEQHRVEVGPEAAQRWPEVRGDPFLSCPSRIA